MNKKQWIIKEKKIEERKRENLNYYRVNEWINKTKTKTICVSVYRVLENNETLKENYLKKNEKIEVRTKNILKKNQKKNLSFPNIIDKRKHLKRKPTKMYAVVENYILKKV